MLLLQDMLAAMAHDVVALADQAAAFILKHSQLLEGLAAQQDLALLNRANIDKREVHDMLMSETEHLMKLVSQLCSHPAWQPQFRELQKSQEPCEAAVKAALHGSINILTKCAGMRLCASLLPEHVSKAITECFLKSEVQEVSAHAAAERLLAEEAAAAERAQSKHAKKQRQKAKRQQLQQQQQQ